MKHGSLFSGIGGFDLASEWMGWDNVFHCEIEPFPKKILQHYWPNADSLGDIKKTDFTKYEGRIDIISGGFPCQPYSAAGKRKGKEDDRHLWPEMLRAIREIKPRWVVGENVYGLINWNGGLVFEEIHTDLEAQGYEVWATILPAVSKDAPHRRDRVWFVAYAGHNATGKAGNSSGNERTGTAFIHSERQGRDATSILDNGFCDIQGLVANGNGTIWEKQHTAPKSSEQEINNRFTYNANSSSKPGKHISQQKKGELDRSNWRNEFSQFANFPTQSPICSGDDGIPDRLDGITFSKWRNESIKGYGNAVVPQVVYEIFKAIEEYDKP